MTDQASDSILGTIRPGTGVIPVQSTPGAGAPSGASSYRAVASNQVTAANLGPLRDFPGFWEGTGFSLIARPDFAGGNPHGFFLELNLLREAIDFTTIGSPVFNRGSVQEDIAIFGVTYLHRVTDATTGEALHIEPGMWLNIPAPSGSDAGGSVARLATVPHGNSICATGIAQELVPDGPPEIPPANTVPFPIGPPPPPAGTPNPFPEYDLSLDTPFRTHPLPAGITQAMVDDPHSVPRDAVAGQSLTHITRLMTSTASAGGIENIPYIVSNADALSLESVFAVQTVVGPNGREYLQLQYSQTALLNFRGMSFPHITAGTLVKAF